jgi:hypothetical protein
MYITIMLLTFLGMCLLLFHFSSLERKVKSEMQNEGKIHRFSDGRVLRSRKPTKYFFARLSSQWTVFTSISFLFTVVTGTISPVARLITVSHSENESDGAIYLCSAKLCTCSMYLQYIPVPVPVPIPVSYRRMVILGHPAKCPYICAF